MLASIIIRTYNEEKHLSQLLESISKQTQDKIKLETIIVDSGSTDKTLDFVSQFDTNIVNIDKKDFTFGRSLNIGCEAATGDFLVFISGHCIPANENWLEQLVEPLINNDGVVYTYGRQIGNGQSRFSECQLFNKYFPETSAVPQDGLFCNNANAALKKDIWKQFLFDESLTGLEDMELARRLFNNGYSLGYVAEAPVYHLHDESWHKVRIRYEREAIALRHIMPEVHVRFRDFLRYYTSAVMMDMGTALNQRVLFKKFNEILMFRLMQYWGGFRGNHEHRKLSEKLREEYFYPK